MCVGFLLIEQIKKLALIFFYLCEAESIFLECEESAAQAGAVRDSLDEGYDETKVKRRPGETTNNLEMLK